MYASLCSEPLWRPKRIFVPSGDQLGSKQPIASGLREPSGRLAAPPHPGTGISCRPLPSEWTSQSVPRSVEGTRAENTISFPCGDQLPHGATFIAMYGVILVSPLPSSLTVKKAGPSFENRRKTSCFPFGEKSPGQSSPNGSLFVVTRWRSAPSDARTV